MQNFTHLHLHTEYSLIDGILRINSLVKQAAKLGMPALAITDQCNLFGAVKFYKAAVKAGVKPILGTDLWMCDPHDRKKTYRLVLLCQNELGYKNLTRLISRAYLEGQQAGQPTIKQTWLQDSSEGLIALSGGREGDVGVALLAENRQLAEQRLQQWQELFPDRYYLELQRTGRIQEEDYISRAITLAEDYDALVVASNDVRFLHREDFEAHEARVCIHEGRILDDARRVQRYSDQQYLRSPTEMATLFADIPEALVNSMEIAKRCNLELSLGKAYLPDFPTPVGMDVNETLVQQTKQGLAVRLAGQHLPAYEQRLQIELDVINSMGYPGYFLIVADFIRWSKQQGIRVGPGRGSGAGSLVAYALDITDIDPLQFELLFERFLNPERVSMPDFDIDFCMEGRDRVIEYVAKKYGHASVSQIITFGTMAAKAVVRDVGRVLGHPYGFVDKLAKLIPFELGITLDQALINEPLLQQQYQQDDDVRILIDLAKKLEGITRNAGKHAAGVVISPTILTDFTPYFCEPDGQHLVTQFDKDDVEAVGLVKFDFLGLRNLTIIDWALAIVNQQREQQGKEPIEIEKLPLDDPTTYKLLKACKTTGIFQFESRGMKDLIRRLQPDCFEDLIALGALFRPGPLQSGMVDDFIDRKWGRSKVEYPHPSLEQVLKPTYGVIVYQEQVMQIAQILAGYTLGGADLLRRAMGKKKPEEMAKQREIFLAGAINNNVLADVANGIFDLMEMFAAYGFNKSHSGAYAMVSYQTAWLKAHYPAAFMAAVLSSDMDNTDKVITLLEDARGLGLEILPPDINSSFYRFTVAASPAELADEKCIPLLLRYGLGAIKGVGEAAIESVIAYRQQHGKFHNLFEFCQRIDTRKINRRTLDALIKAGAMDSLGAHRASLLASVEVAMQLANQATRDQNSGQYDLFAQVEMPTVTPAKYVVTEEWSDEVRLQAEKDTLGFYLSGHPIDRYRKELQYITPIPIGRLTLQQNRNIKLAGLIVASRTMQTKRGKRIAFVTVDDGSGRMEIAFFAECYATYRDFLVKDQVLIIEAEVGIDRHSDSYRLSAVTVWNMDQIRSQYAKDLLIKLSALQFSEVTIQQLQAILQPYCGGACPVTIQYQQGAALANLSLGIEWQVNPKDELLHRLYDFLGKVAIDVIY
ncbi:DNA polymerase III subunit alpha [soil metagenome]